MVDRFYGLDRGEEGSVVPTEQSTSPTKDVEVAIDLATVTEKREALALLKVIMDHITITKWPPA